jgi:hypothetical protein
MHVSYVANLSKSLQKIGKWAIYPLTNGKIGDIMTTSGVEE